ncbi:hypothetical protein M8R20_09380 [Pseudomonas sp. R2.Fl]|nr:hypothetical protein [Pseudomonas sp. R2.Fl]
MLFGKSLFQSVVDRLLAEAPEPEETGAPPPAGAPRGLAASFLAGATEAEDADRTAPRFDPYREAALTAPPPPPKPTEPEKPPMPPYLKRLGEAEIAEDLGIAPGDDAGRLADRRRAFALLNHPDRVAQDYRAQATVRMTIANALVDDALQRLDRSTTAGFTRRRQS